MPKILSLHSVPRRNAVLMSKLCISHPILAAGCKINTLESFGMVGLEGSGLPSTTQYHEARFWLLTRLLDAPCRGAGVTLVDPEVTPSSASVQVRIHLQRRMFSVRDNGNSKLHRSQWQQYGMSAR